MKLFLVKIPTKTYLLATVALRLQTCNGETFISFFIVIDWISSNKIRVKRIFYSDEITNAVKNPQPKKKKLVDGSSLFVIKLDSR